MFFIHILIASTCRIQWNSNNSASTRKTHPRIHLLVRFLAYISKNKTREYLQGSLFTESRMFILKNWKTVFSCVCFWHAFSGMYHSTVPSRNNCKTLTWPACLRIKYDHFKIFLQLNTSLWEFLANTRVFQILTFD